eukprot:gene20774-22802_t
MVTRPVDVPGDLEAIVLEADELVLQSTVEDVKRIAEKLELEDGLSRAKLVKTITRYLEEKKDAEIFAFVKMELPKEPPPLIGGRNRQKLRMRS